MRTSFGVAWLVLFVGCGGHASDQGNSGSSDDGGNAGDGDPAGTCLADNTNYEAAGPFQYTAASSGSVELWVPKVPAGCKVPIIHFANAAPGATCSDYRDGLVRFATHGFLTTCSEDGNAETGTQGIIAFETAMTMYPNLADKKLGSTGYSQGGDVAFKVLQLAEAKWGSTMTYAGLAMEPAITFGSEPPGSTWQTVYGKIRSPMFMFSGTSDPLVSPDMVRLVYDAMNPNNEVYWWSATGATYIPIPLVPEEQVSIPWFRWKLLGDNEACKFFKEMPNNTTIIPGWTKVMSENETSCEEVQSPAVPPTPTPMQDAGGDAPIAMGTPP